MIQNPPLSAPMRLKTHTWLAVFCTVLSLQAQVQTNGPTRPITLQECIRLALENNFTIAIERYQPRLQAYALGADYGYYDPVFSVTASHSDTTSEGEFDPRTGIQLPAGGGREDDIVDASLSGVLWPTGLRYDIGATYVHRTGTTLRDVFRIQPED